MAGGIKTGLLLWESCVMPFLINNSSTWLQMKKSDMDRLIKLENNFFNSLLAVRNCPTMAMYWDIGSLVFPLRILKEKLLLYHHISCLQETAVAYSVLVIQERQNLPSLKDEIIHFLRKYEIVDVRKFSKLGWRKYVREKIHEMNREFILENSKKYKKLDYMSMACEEYGLKDYFNCLNLTDSRIKFRERSKCMTSCRTDYPSDQGNIKAMFQCFHCDEIDSVGLHWKLCPGYAHLRENRNLQLDTDLCGYYRDIINLREQE